MVEVLWKTVTSLLNHRLTTAVKFHDVLNGFWAGCGMGNDTSKSNLLQHIKSMREFVLFKVFLDFHKEYDDLDWDRWLEILAAYGFSSRRIQLLWTYWDQMTMVDKAGGYFGHIFKGYHRVTKFKPLYPRSSTWSWTPSSYTG